jgi:hypothetical protein
MLLTTTTSKNTIKITTKITMMNQETKIEKEEAIRVINGIDK